MIASEVGRRKSSATATPLLDPPRKGLGALRSAPAGAKDSDATDLEMPQKEHAAIANSTARSPNVRPSGAGRLPVLLAPFRLSARKGSRPSGIR